MTVTMHYFGDGWFFQNNFLKKLNLFLKCVFEAVLLINSCSFKISIPTLSKLPLNFRKVMLGIKAQTEWNAIENIVLHGT
jgi:hypothetical protein